MNERNQDIWSVIASFLKQKGAAEEKEMLEKWKSEDQINAKVYSILEDIGNKNEKIPVQTEERIYEHIKKTLFPETHRRKLKMWQYAAVASFLLFVSLSFFMLLKNNGNDFRITDIEITTPLGTNSKLSLPDGTIVYLNSGSYLKYPSLFNKENRTVVLSGEAYFEVAKDSLHPFIVQANAIMVKVLGTHFNIRAYNNDNYIETTLIEGSIELFDRKAEEHNSGVKMLPQQQAIYNIDAKNLTIKTVDAEMAAAWKDGTFYFQNETFLSIAKKLERNFNVAIRIESKEMEQEAFYGLFVKNKNIFHLLDLMKSYSNFNYKLQGDTILITKSN